MLHNHYDPSVNGSPADFTDSAIGSADSCSTDSCLESAASSLEITADNTKTVIFNAANHSRYNTINNSWKNSDQFHRGSWKSCVQADGSFDSFGAYKDNSLPLPDSLNNSKNDKFQHDSWKSYVEGAESLRPELRPPDPHVPEQIAAYISLYLRSDIRPKGKGTFTTFTTFLSFWTSVLAKVFIIPEPKFFEKDNL